MYFPDKINVDKEISNIISSTQLANMIDGGELSRLMRDTREFLIVSKSLEKRV